METSKCSICGKESIVHLQQLVNGSMQHIYLCETCARNYGVLPNDSLPFSIVKTASYALFNKVSTQAKFNKSCKICGQNAQDIINNGSVGCSQCYVCLEENIVMSLQKIQKSLIYSGKRPKCIDNKLKLTSDRGASYSLQKSMKEESCGKS